MSKNTFHDKKHHKRTTCPPKKKRRPAAARLHKTRPFHHGRHTRSRATRLRPHRWIEAKPPDGSKVFGASGWCCCCCCCCRCRCRCCCFRFCFLQSRGEKTVVKMMAVLDLIQSTRMSCYRVAEADDSPEHQEDAGF